MSTKPPKGYGVGWNRKASGRALRNDYGVVGYIGANASGKTACAVWDSLPSLDSGRPVLSTVRICDFRNPRLCDDVTCGCDKTNERRHAAAHPLWVPFTEWAQLTGGWSMLSETFLPSWDFGDVIMDEVSGVASSRASHQMPSSVERHLQQLRKGDTIVRWTAPSWKRADTIIRECSQVVVSCRGFMAKSHEARDGEIQRRWKQRRLFVWRTFDAYAFEDFTVNAREKLKPMGLDWHWGPGSPTFDAYDTYQKALAIGSVDDLGRCVICNRRKSVPNCKGHDDLELPGALVLAGGGSPPAGSPGHGGPPVIDLPAPSWRHR